MRKFICKQLIRYSSSQQWKIINARVNSYSTATSLRDVARGELIHSLILSKSDDLICKNLMCEFVESPCICRLSIVLNRVPALTVLNLSNNQLHALPDNLYQLKHLNTLDISQNKLKNLSSQIKELSNLEVLDLRHNEIKELPEKELLQLTKLKVIYLYGNSFNINDIRSSELQNKIDIITNNN